MDRDWTYFLLVALGAGLLVLWQRRRPGHRRGLVPVVLAILAIILVLALAVRG